MPGCGNLAGPCKREHKSLGASKAEAAEEYFGVSQRFDGRQGNASLELAIVPRGFAGRSPVVVTLQDHGDAGAQWHLRPR